VSADDVIQEALDAAKKEFLTDQKRQENQETIGEIMDHLNNSICERVINGTVVLRIEVSECKINTYKITESKTFFVDNEGGVEP
jgi:hypothetical protein